MNGSNVRLLFEGGSYMFRDFDLYKKISISKKIEVVKVLTLLVDFENFEWPAQICPLT